MFKTSSLGSDAVDGLSKFSMALYNESGKLWSAKDLQDSNKWKFEIPKELLSSLVVIGSWMNSCGYNWDSPAVANLEIKGLSLFAKLIESTLRLNSGVALISGLDILAHGEAVSRLFYLKLGQAIGSVSAKRGLLYDVTNRGLDYRQDNVLVSGTNQSPGFHTDSTDRNFIPGIIGLMCLRPAKSGGNSRIVSALSVYEQLQQHYPKVLARLSQDFIRDKIVLGERVPRSLESRRSHRFPVFEWGRWYRGLSFRYMRYWIESGYEKAGMSLGDKDIHALDTLDHVLNQPTLAYEFKLNPGQILLLNNHTVAHDRTYYEDWPEPDRTRLLVRMWVENDALMSPGEAPFSSALTQS